MHFITRDFVLEGLKNAGIRCETVTDDELKRLRKIISKNLRRSGIYQGTARLARAKKNLKFIEIKTELWGRREAVSFNQDGFIRIADWADDSNVQPVLSALIEWSTT